MVRIDREHVTVLERVIKKSSIYLLSLYAVERYSLIVYTVMINRWWPLVFAIGLFMLGLAWTIRWRGYESWRWLTLGVIGGFILLTGLFMLAFRKSAYVQLFNNHRPTK